MFQISNWPKIQFLIFSGPTEAEKKVEELTASLEEEFQRFFFYFQLSPTKKNNIIF